MTIDHYVAIILIALVVGVVLLASWQGSEGVASAFEGFFAGFRPDPWPRGVQEEDGVRPWGTYVPSSRVPWDADPPDDAAKLGAVIRDVVLPARDPSRPRIHLFRVKPAVRYRGV